MVHGFYALMGGFAISIPKDLPESESFIPSSSCGNWFITATGLEFLLAVDKDQLPALTEAEIKSHSKANGLAKTLVCSQAVWFLASCISRCKYWSPENGEVYLTSGPVAQRIPVSLLELNTFGHAVCTLFIYLLWWEKPFEVDIPTTINSQALLDTFALVWINTGGTGGALSPLVESVRRDYEAFLNSDRDFLALDQVGFSFPSQLFVLLEG